MKRWLLLGLLLAACSRPRPVAPPPPVAPEAAPAESTPVPAAKPAPTAEADPPSHALVDPRDISDDQLPAPVRERKARLLTFVQKLTAEEAELVCFTLGLIPRDEVFDDVNLPKRKLQRYTSRALTNAELQTIESALKELRH